MVNKDPSAKNLIPGFTLLEVMAATVLLSLLAVFFYAPQVASDAQRLRRMQAEVVIEEMNRIAYLSQQWTLENNGKWPGHTDSCVSAFSFLAGEGLFNLAATKSPLYQPGLKNFPLNAPLQRGEYGRYYSSCVPQTFNLLIMLDGNNAKWGNYIAKLLAGSDLKSYNSGKQVAVIASWPLPSAIPALDAYVIKHAPMFTGPLASNIDLGGHATYSASDVVLHNGHSLGKTIHYGAQVIPGAAIKKPVCAPGLSSQILTSFNHLLHETGKPLHLAEATVASLHGRWLVGSRVVDSDGAEDVNNNNVRINVLVYCS